MSRARSIGRTGELVDQGSFRVAAGTFAIAILILFPVCDPIWLAAAIGAAPFAIAILRGGDGIMRPSVLVPLIYALYALGPILVDMGYAAEVLTSYGNVHLIGVLGLTIGLRIGEGAAADQRQPVGLPTLDRSALRLTILVLFALGGLSIATQVAAFGGLSGLLAVGYGGQRFQVLHAARTFGAGFEWWLLACCLLGYLALAARRPSLLWAAMSLALPVLLLLLRIGGRSGLVYAALFGFVVFHEGWRRLRPRLVLLSLVGGVILAQFYSLARFWLDAGLWNALRVTAEIARRAPEALLPTASNEFRAPSAALLDVLQFARFDRWGGQSYLDALLAAAPGLADLFDRTSATPSIWRLQEFHPEVLAVGGGLGFSPAAEGWLNFGSLGVALHLVAYGLLIGSAYRWHRARATVLSLLLLAGLLPMFALDGLRIHTAAFVYKTTRVYLMPFFVFILARDLLRLASARRLASGEGR